MRCMRQVGNNEWREESYVYGQYMYRRGKKIRKEKKINKKIGRVSRRSGTMSQFRDSASMASQCHKAVKVV